MTDPFAAAAAAATAAATQPTSPAPAQGLIDQNEDGGSSLFGGEKLPGLFNKFTMPGEWRTGIITKPPVDRQSRDMAGNLKYWDPDKNEPTTVNTGRPLNDTVIVLQTEYRYTPQEIADRNLDPIDVEDDKGIRGIFASGDEKKAIIKAVRESRLRKESEMVGWRLSGRRMKKEPIPGTGFSKWTGWEYKLERV